MFLRDVSNQLLNELKANWQKSALLGCLFLVGLFFWVPPLYRALAGRKPVVAATPATASQPAVAHSSQTGSSQTGSSRTGGAKQTASANTVKPNRSDAGRARRADPLVQSVTPSAIRKDPFRVDMDQFSPPVVFVDEPKVSKSKLKASVVQTPLHLPEGLVLKSTILSAKRKAAFINRKLYFPGMDVRFDGVSYKLVAIHPRRVVLRRGNVDFDLTIRKRNRLKAISQQQSFVQPAGQSAPVRKSDL